jgi:hypothetical protein
MTMEMVTGPLAWKVENEILFRQVQELRAEIERLKKAAVYLAYHSRPDDLTAVGYNPWAAARDVVLADNPPYPCVPDPDAG